MAGTAQHGGKKGRKYGRKKGKPAQKRYTAEGRWIKNKARKIRSRIRIGRSNGGVG